MMIRYPLFKVCKILMAIIWFIICIESILVVLIVHIKIKCHMKLIKTNILSQDDPKPNVTRQQQNHGKKTI